MAKHNENINLIYLDNASTTRVTEPVLQSMIPYLTEQYGNPSSLHSLGRTAKKAIEHAREQAAKAINAEPEQIFFTSGATESNNHIVKEYATIICSNVEHHSILNIPCVISLPIKNMFDIGLRYDPPLAAVMYVNNETGEIFDIRSLAEKAHSLGMDFHTDATQAFGHIPIDVKELNVDSLSLSGHKFHAPKGIGILYLKEPSAHAPMIYGGGQQDNLRSGTENVAAIVGLGTACELYNFNPETDKLNREKCEKFITVIRSIPDMKINTDLENSIATTINMSFKDIEGESLMLLLDQEGVCVSSGSACNSGSLEPSHVLKAMGISEDFIYGTIRVSFSSETTEEDLLTAAEAIKRNVNKIRGMSNK